MEEQMLKRIANLSMVSLSNSLGLLILLLILSCEKRNEVIHEKFYKNGNIKTHYTSINDTLFGEYLRFYKNGNLESKDIYYRNIKIDSSITFDSVSRVIKKIIYWDTLNNTCFAIKEFNKDKTFTKGRICDSLKIGKWSYYKNGKLEKIYEYKNINNTQYLNQNWVYDFKGNEKNEASHNYKFSVETNLDEEGLNKIITIKYNPLISKDAKVILLLNSKLNSNYSNKDNLPYDTLHFDNSVVNFKLNLKLTNPYQFRAIIKEYADLIPEFSDGFDYKERFVYVDEIINIKGNGSE